MEINVAQCRMQQVLDSKPYLLEICYHVPDHVGNLHHSSTVMAAFTQ